MLCTDPLPKIGLQLNEISPDHGSKGLVSQLIKLTCRVNEIGQHGKEWAAYVVYSLHGAMNNVFPRC